MVVQCTAESTDSAQHAKSMYSVELEFNLWQYLYSHTVEVIVTTKCPNLQYYTLYNQTEHVAESPVAENFHACTYVL